jgi:hypothetical protein
VHGSGPRTCALRGTGFISDWLWVRIARALGSVPARHRTTRNESNTKVRILGAEDYSGLSPNTAPGPGPKYLDYYKNAHADAGIGYDVYDVDALGRTAPSYLGGAQPLQGGRLVHGR